MADTQQPPDSAKVADKPQGSASDGEAGALSKMLNDVYAELGKLGIGPQSTVKETTLKCEIPTDKALLPPVDLFDGAKMPVTEAAPTAPADATSPLQLPFKLEMPALKFEGDGYSVSVAPTGNPLKHKGGIEVTGTFSSL